MERAIQIIKVPVDIWPSRRDWRATVVNIAKQIGDLVYYGDLIAELELEKVVVEIESPIKGKIKELFVKLGDKVKPGDPIAAIDPF